MNARIDIFFDKLKHAVDEDKLDLPSLPEVALKIRDVAEDENSTTQQVADILCQDGSLSARLLKVANSPLYRSRVPIDDLHTAITRLGIKLVRDVVINLAMKQIYQPTSVAMEAHFRQTWNNSINVAALSQMMSTTVPGIKKEKALLAGLIHNIGSLPILLLAENDVYLFHDTSALNSLVMDLQGRVGAMILKSWYFSDEMINVVSQCHNFAYRHEGEADLLDVVQCALLQGGVVDDKYTPDDLSQVAAFSKLGMDCDINVVHLEQNQELIDDVKQSLMV